MKKFLGLVLFLTLLVSCSPSSVVDNTTSPTEIKEPVALPTLPSEPKESIEEELTTEEEIEEAVIVDKSIKPEKIIRISIAGDPMLGEQLCEGFYYGYVIDNNGRYLFDGDRPVILLDNINAKNPTYQQLITFLEKDNTEQYSYPVSWPAISLISQEDLEATVDKEYLLMLIEGEIHPNLPQSCAGFAEMLHNNAEIAGIRVGYVLATNHALNIFQTIDKGFIYIDCTGSLPWVGGGFDCRVFLDSKGLLTPKPLHPKDVDKEVYYTSESSLEALSKPAYWSPDYKPPESTGIYLEEIIWVGTLKK